MYAIIKTGGKQYKVQEGEVLSIEKLALDEGETVEFDEVLMVSKDGNTVIGTPNVESATVTGKVTKHGRGKRLLYLNTNSRRTIIVKGHRQAFTQVVIEKINA